MESNESVLLLLLPYSFANRAGAHAGGKTPETTKCVDLPADSTR